MLSFYIPYIRVIYLINFPLSFLFTIKIFVTILKGRWFINVISKSNITYADLMECVLSMCNESVTATVHSFPTDHVLPGNGHYCKLHLYMPVTTFVLYHVTLANNTRLFNLPQTFHFDHFSPSLLHLVGLSCEQKLPWSSLTMRNGRCGGEPPPLLSYKKQTFETKHPRFKSFKYMDCHFRACRLESFLGTPSRAPPQYLALLKYYLPTSKQMCITQTKVPNYGYATLFHHQ